MKKLWLIPLAMILLWGLSFHGAAALTEYEEGLSLYQGGKFEEAKVKFEAYLTVHPDDPNTLYYLGVLETDGMKSQEYYRRLWIEYPDHPLADDALYAIAKYNYARGYYPTARGMFRYLITLYPQSEFVEESQYWLGVVYLAANSPDSARAEFRRFLERYPKSPFSPWAVLGIADSYFQEGKVDRAYEEYQGVLRSSFGKQVKCTALYRLGECSQSLGQEERARKYFDRVLQECPQSCEAYVLRWAAEELAEKPEVEQKEEEPAPIPRYTVQVGAFSSLENAQRLRQRLEEKGYPAEISPTQVDGTRFYRVWVGRFADREEAEALAGKLAAEEGLKYRIATIEE